MKKLCAKDKVFCKKDGQDTYYIANYYYIYNVDWQHPAPTSLSLCIIPPLGLHGG